MSVPDDRKYLDSHEWFKMEGETVTIGISQFAADELTDVTYVELPNLGTHFNPGDVIGEIESVKATSEIYTAIGGEVCAVNSELAEHPELVNDDAFGKGWMIQIKAQPKANDSSRGEKLMSAAQYEEHIA